MMPLRSQLVRHSTLLFRWQTVLSTQATIPRWNAEDTNVQKERERRLGEMLRANSAAFNSAFKNNAVHASVDAALHPAAPHEQLKIEDVLTDTFRSKLIPSRQTDRHLFAFECIGESTPISGYH